MKLRVFTAFSGYDSQCMALDRAGIPYELVGWSEIDKYAIQAHNAVCPQWADRNYGDICKIDWPQVPDFDFFTYSSPCLTADSLILTKEGYKAIDDVAPGDIVLTKSGEWHSVIKKFDNGMSPTVHLRGMGFADIHCTPNHKFWVREMKRVGHCRRRTLTEPEFVDAKDLKGNHYFGIPLDTRSELPAWGGVEDNRWGHHRNSNKLTAMFTTGHFWYLMGRYVGDGWKKHSLCGKGIVICCGGRNEQQLRQTISSLGFKATVSSERTVRKYTISSNELYAFVDRFGYRATGKRIDGETMALPSELLGSFLRGVVDSDGCCEDGKYKIVTTSHELAQGLAFCVNKALHRPVRVYKCKREETSTIEGRLVRQHDSYEVVFTREARTQEHSFIENNYIWYPFRGILPGEIERVYNIEVDEDHSYIVNGCISKNCQDFSNAGLQKGGEEGSGTRSSLLWECRRAIEIKRPKFLMMENVKALVSKKFMPLFQKWLDTLQGYGYTNYWKVLNAKDYGVPQNRERVFVISVFGAHEPFRFPEGWPLPIVLQDVLEDRVDEHYYLKPEMLDRFRYDPKFIAEIERVTGEKLETFPAKSGETVVAATAQDVEDGGSATEQDAGTEDNGHTLDVDDEGSFGIDLEDESTWLF